MRRFGRFLAVAALALTSMGMLVAPASASGGASSPQRAAVGCYGPSCTGENPEAMGCGADARTLEQVYINGTAFEIRYSPACDASWGRIGKLGMANRWQTNLDGNPPDSEYSSYTFSAVAETQYDPGYENFWTAMGAGIDSTRVCARIDTAYGWTPWYCTGWY
ncbi:DUF2690 domain-containing protein [Actinopolyspora sp. BKK1]|nr:DUF2690 domain-containing protein [Actinopolyspora sp. BKK2]NHE75791.1 DUF2690 domain-containing protein [Actinopolyspora sp. BKK1]